MEEEAANIIPKDSWLCHRSDLFDDIIAGLEDLKQLSIPEYTTVEMEVVRSSNTGGRSDLRLRGTLRMSRQDGLLCILFMQIIMLNTACENPSTLFKFLSDQLPPYAKLSYVQRKYFDEAKGNVQFLRLYTLRGDYRQN